MSGQVTTTGAAYCGGKWPKVGCGFCLGFQKDERGSRERDNDDDDEEDDDDDD